MSVEVIGDSAAERPRRLRLPSLARVTEDFDLRNTWQIVVGALLMPLGLGVILLGWQGASHARVVQQQIPYLVSGSFIGLGLMIAGGLLFWAHWLYRIYDQADLHHQQLLEAIGQLAGTSPATAVATVPTTGQRLVATGSGTNFHRADCSVVKGRRGTRTVSGAEAASMTACRICDPLAD